MKGYYLLTLLAFIALAVSLWQCLEAAVVTQAPLAPELGQGEPSQKKIAEMRAGIASFQSARGYSILGLGLGGGLTILALFAREAAVKQSKQ